ncbi:MAG: polysaccharide pyruvyl transferase family protein [Kiritimatiellae bacterium]|nr:polysaccharide pyruvyl transferase family protein [Kiritimatiellia bacterium]
MRIGVITFVNRNCNYGGVFQGVAMRDYLRSLGHEAVLLDVQFDRVKSPFLKFLERPAKGILERVKVRRFAPFKRKYVASGLSPFYPLEAFLADPPPYDAYVCGSDQIWNKGICAHPLKRRLFFLDFGPEGARRIAYAASWGAAATDPVWERDVAACLRRFDAISVREESGVAMAAKLGAAATWLPDPTLLHTPDYWGTMADGAVHPAAGTTLFKCEYRWTPVVPFATVEQLIREAYPSIRTVVPFSNKPLRECAMFRCLSPEEWLSHVRHATFVLTNSYHATLFSIQFHRPFLVVPLDGKYAGMNERIFSITSRLGLQDRIVQSAAPDLLRERIAAPIDWDRVERTLAPWREEARRFLTEHLR